MSKVLRGKIVSPGKLERGHDNASKMVYGEGRWGASLRGVRIAPNKARLVADQIRGLPVERARQVLRFSNKRAAYMIDRVLLSALGNCEHLEEGDVEPKDLIVAEAYCDEGTRMKRFKAGPMGRARPIIRRMCHITVVVAQNKQEEKKEAKAKKSAKAAK